MIRRTLIRSEMPIDSYEVFRKIDEYLASNINATLQDVSKKLGISEQGIDQITKVVERKSFRELQENRRLARVFELLIKNPILQKEIWKEQRARPRIFIPWTTVRYAICSSGNQEGSYSNLCPAINFNITGLAFLADDSLKPGTKVSLFLTLSKEDETYRLKGNVVYSVGADIAGYRHRMGIKFEPFTEGKESNIPKVLDVLTKFEKDYHSQSL
jgi:hypothetical protein